MATDSWRNFGDNLVAENKALAQLGTATLELTQALVGGKPADIEAADKKVNAYRVVFLVAHDRRIQLQTRGFGDLELQKVCVYAPAAMRRPLVALVKDMEIRGIALQLTVSNNKALILAGLERLQRTVRVIQESMTEKPGTYKRRGIVPPPSGSVLVSRKA
ncbi:MAG: hypothetical protein WCE44_04165 [Candidatus Velthaea sp.]|jgi:hypothetical protein